MAKKKKYACKTAKCSTKRRRFGVVAKQARAACIKDATNIKAFDACVGSYMKGELAQRGSKATRAKRK